MSRVSQGRFAYRPSPQDDGRDPSGVSHNQLTAFGCVCVLQQVSNVAQCSHGHSARELGGKKGRLLESQCLLLKVMGGIGSLPP